MQRTMTYTHLAPLMTAAALAACAAPSAPATSAPPLIGMANPASVHCERLGGRLEIRKDEQGNESGWCHLPDGRVVEEWALFRGEVQGVPGVQQLQGEDEAAPK